MVGFHDKSAFNWKRRNSTKRRRGYDIWGCLGVCAICLACEMEEFWQSIENVDEKWKFCIEHTLVCIHLCVADEFFRMLVLHTNHKEHAIGEVFNLASGLNRNSWIFQCFQEISVSLEAINIKLWMGWKYIGVIAKIIMNADLIYMLFQFRSIEIDLEYDVWSLMYDRCNFVFYLRR